MIFNLIVQFSSLLCEAVECSPLDAPQNGALACDLWQYGKFCTMLCNANFDIPYVRRGVKVEKQYVCGSSGMWTPSSEVPDCSGKNLIV